MWQVTAYRHMICISPLCAISCLIHIYSVDFTLNTTHPHLTYISYNAFKRKTRFKKFATPCRIQIFKKLADIPDLGFLGEKSNKKPVLEKKCFLTPMGPLVKIGGQIDFF